MSTCNTCFTLNVLTAFPQQTVRPVSDAAQCGVRSGSALASSVVETSPGRQIDLLYST